MAKHPSSEAPNDNLEIIEHGGVTSAAGFRAGGIHAGFRRDPNRLDLALVEADELCPVAATFTQNVFCAAPIQVSKAHLDQRGYGLGRAIVINSGNANAATGSVGLAAAQQACELVGEAIGCSADDVLVASTGVIGQILDLAPYSAIDALRAQVSTEGGSDAARAIMTTDTVSKEVAVSYVSADPAYAGKRFTVGGMSKGSGMIMPNMATMISVLTTDAPFSPEALHTALVTCVNESFNKITVDSDTSTNDCCFLFASGKAASQAPAIKEGTQAFDEFVAALSYVTQTLARMMARDGEGATKLVTVKITGARSAEEADLAARTVANSPLVKTAIFGHDANWGRIAGALGRSGARFNQEDVSIDIMGIPVCRKGLALEFDEDEALKHFEEPEIVLEADLGAGDASTTMWTCDFSYDYVRINGDYRT
ncbi:bifunctional glutamate N-acetyltransferase/amino-acid acetyltransferase ArgJ [Anaerotardibacter muris]|uniref:bifunctional glutamate N-acetyltransferase/amino-acid acetyltransferase ArgJ n=1 Tax=Anaerotardibacter muris TaxID=2941505 RepID=UPI0020409736|nr:bifunctional glutamate N-acetyltransferase/amino-acid acetyltransferase ArgJ [Anaerotardibacter muris]